MRRLINIPAYLFGVERRNLPANEGREADGRDGRGGGEGTGRALSAGLRGSRISRERNHSRWLSCSRVVLASFHLRATCGEPGAASVTGCSLPRPTRARSARAESEFRALARAVNCTARFDRGSLGDEERVDQLRAGSRLQVSEIRARILSGSEKTRDIVIFALDPTSMRADRSSGDFQILRESGGRLSVGSPRESRWKDTLVNYK